MKGYPYPLPLSSGFARLFISVLYTPPLPAALRNIGHVEPGQYVQTKDLLRVSHAEPGQYFQAKDLLRVSHAEPGQYVKAKEDYPESAVQNQVNMFKQKKITQSRPCRTGSICSNKRRLPGVGRAEPGQYVQIKEDYPESAVQNQVNMFK